MFALFEIKNGKKSSRPVSPEFGAIGACMDFKERHQKEYPESYTRIYQKVQREGDKRAKWEVFSGQSAGAIGQTAKDRIANQRKTD